MEGEKIIERKKKSALQREKKVMQQSQQSEGLSTQEIKMTETLKSQHTWQTI